MQKKRYANKNERSNSCSNNLGDGIKSTVEELMPKGVFFVFSKIVQLGVRGNKFRGAKWDN